MNEMLVFDTIEPIEVPVQVGKENYLLREASGEVAIQYQNAMTKCTRFVNGEFGGVQGDLASVQPLLVSLCLFKESLPGNGQFTVPVSEVTIRSWPSRVQKALFEKAKEISLLEESETEEDLVKQIAKLQKKLDAIREGKTLKNLPSDTTGGSE